MRNWTDEYIFIILLLSVIYPPAAFAALLVLHTAFWLNKKIVPLSAFEPGGRSINIFQLRKCFWLGQILHQMKFLFFCLLSVIYQPGFSQIDTSKKLSSITLDTVILSAKANKIVKVHLKGFPGYNGLSQTNAVISYVGMLPKGILKSVTFYFNCGLVNHLKKRLKINYKDVELGLLIYKANSDSTLGDLISQDDIKFTITAKHRGPFKVDVSSLQVEENCIFIGFSVLSQLPKDENNIYVRYNETKNGKSYVKMNLPFRSDNWQKPFDPNPSELKLSLEILQ